ncbi:hypothetical protein [Chryseobacterium carnipullorum]|uniref:hypothetical protein n=1 Tax=Chryseobacterium carnipullorum TaxID=1124835 RepID=UPI000E9495BB|nr:hypothetical protein [Chryseobacterium carnipullorum]HBV17364.1 hypothetical protein [Chryseobacterium carnipullorum]
MKKKIIIIAGFLLAQFAFSQVGINNTSPKATLDVTAKTTDGSKPEGLIAPRLTGDQIKAANTQYGANQTGTLVYATAAVSSPDPKTVNITSTGYYYFDGDIWQKVINSNTAAENGLAMSGNKVKLGGALTEATTISGATTNNKLSLEGTGKDAINFDNYTATTTVNNSTVSTPASSLSVDAENHRIGIGTKAPTQELDIEGKLRIGKIEKTSSASVSSLVRDDHTGEIKVAGTVKNNKPINYITYVAKGVYAGNLESLDTNISENDYTIVVVGSTFSEKTIFNQSAGADGAYNPLNVYAFKKNGTWRLHAEYFGGGVSGGGDWTIYCLVINNSLVKVHEIVTTSLIVGGNQTSEGSATVPQGL